MWSAYSRARGRKKQTHLKREWTNLDLSCLSKKKSLANHNLSKHDLSTPVFLYLYSASSDKSSKNKNFITICPSYLDCSQHRKPRPKSCWRSSFVRGFPDQPEDLVFTTPWVGSADFDIFLIFPRKQYLTFQANYLHWRQFAWKIKFSLEKLEKYFSVISWKFYPLRNCHHKNTPI